MSLEGNVSNIPNLNGKVRDIPLIDKTLTKEGHGADAKAVGDKFKEFDRNKAPSGYGLGTHSTGLTNVDLNNVTEAGFYCFDSGVGVANAPTSLPSIFGVHPFYNENYAEQKVLLLDGLGTRVRRVRHNGKWQPWEYENPPMTLWEEYRTTERYMGRPVYTKLITAKYGNDIGNSGGPYNFAIEFSTPSVQHLVRYGGTVAVTGADGWPSPRAIPHFNDEGGYMGVNYVNNGGMAIHMEKCIVPANTDIYIQIWYTKLGD